MRFIDLFGGIGGFSLGMQKHGHKCVGYYENDKRCVDVYNKNFGTGHEPVDVCGLEPWKIPSHDIMCAGFPCQAFSNAGQRRGFYDTRGTLFFEILRIAKQKRTPILVLENVKGLLFHNQGRTFETMLNSLDEAGYDAQWEVLNAKHFGLAQNRERVFIVANRREKPCRQIFPLGNGFEIPEKEQQGRKDKGKDIATALTSNYHKGVHNRGETYIAMHSLAWRTRTKQGQPGHFELRKDEVSNALNTATKDYSVAYCDMEGIHVRRLTPTECERLLGFPDGWTSSVADTHRYRMLGNAVPVNVVEEIAKAII